MTNLLGKLIKPNDHTVRRFARCKAEVGIILIIEEVDSIVGNGDFSPARQDMYTVLVGENTLRLFRTEFEVI